MAGKDNLTVLQEAGVKIEQIPEPQREVLEQLSQDELQALISINQKMEAANEVQGYLAAGAARGDTGYIIY
jgi:hypothetical protein